MEVSTDRPSRDRGHGAAVAQVDGDAVDRVLVDPEHFGRTASHVAVARAVESVAADAELLVELVGQRVGVGDFGNRGVKGGVEAGDLRNVGQFVHGRPNAREVRRIVQRRQVGETLDRGDHFRRDQDRTGELLAAVDHAMPDRADLLGGFQDSVRPGQRFENQGHAFLVVGNLALQPAHLVGIVMLAGRRDSPRSARPAPSKSRVSPASRRADT